MVDGSSGRQAGRATSRFRLAAWIMILVVGVGFVGWGGMAALAPEKLIGPGGAPIVHAEYEGFTGLSWSALVKTSPVTADFMTVVFRVYGAYNVAFAVLAIFITVTAFRRGDAWAWWALLLGYTITLGSAIVFDRTVRAIGPFELTEYVGLGIIWLACIMTAPFLPWGRAGRSAG